MQIAVVILHDRAPQEHCLAREQLAEHGDTLLLNGEPILQVQAGGESVVILQVLVDDFADGGPTLLVVVEPLLNLVLQVLFSGTRKFQLGVRQLLEPVGVARFDGAIHTDDEVQHGLGLLCLHQNELACEKPLSPTDTTNLVEDRFHANIFNMDVIL